MFTIQMIFQRHELAVLLGGGQTFLNGIDAPLEALVLRMAGQHRLNAARSHEGVKGLDGTPAAGVEADAGDAQLVRQLEAFHGVINVALAFLGIRADEALVNGQAD